MISQGEQTSWIRRFIINQRTLFLKQLQLSKSNETLQWYLLLIVKQWCLEHGKHSIFRYVKLDLNIKIKTMPWAIGFFSILHFDFSISLVPFICSSCNFYYVLMITKIYRDIEESTYMIQMIVVIVEVLQLYIAVNVPVK